MRATTMSRRGDVWDDHLGGVRVLNDLCSTCIYRPGNLMCLPPGRLAEMTAKARADDGYVICHQTLRHGSHPNAGEALCRGFFNLPKPTAFLQIMGRLGTFRYVPPPGKDTNEH